MINGEIKQKKLPALLFCLFLDYLGAHRFYVGKRITAMLFIILTGLKKLWLYIPSLQLKYPDYKIIYSFVGIIVAFWIIVDAIRIITGNFTDSQGQALKDWK